MRKLKQRKLCKNLPWFFAGIPKWCHNIPHQGVQCQIPDSNLPWQRNLCCLSKDLKYLPRIQHSLRALHTQCLWIPPFVLERKYLSQKCLFSVHNTWGGKSHKNDGNTGLAYRVYSFLGETLTHFLRKIGFQPGRTVHYIWENSRMFALFPD